MIINQLEISLGKTRENGANDETEVTYQEQIH